MTGGYAHVPNARMMRKLAPFCGHQEGYICNHEAAMQVFDARMMRKLATFRGHQADVTCAAWHPWHEDLFVSGSHDGTILHWLVSHPAEPQASCKVPQFLFAAPLYLEPALHSAPIITGEGCRSE